MSERYSAKEGLEQAEHAHESAEGSRHPLLRMAPLISAILAIFAGLSSLYSSRLGEAMLAAKNEAVLAQAHATDVWGEYEADSLKAHMAETGSLLATSVDLRRRFQSDFSKYRHRQDPLRREATRDESERDAATLRAGHVEAKKIVFDVAVALFEIAIVMTSVAALSRQPWLTILGGLIGVAGLGFALRGLLVM